MGEGPLLTLSANLTGVLGEEDPAAGHRMVGTRSLMHLLRWGVSKNSDMKKTVHREVVRAAGCVGGETWTGETRIFGAVKGYG